LIHPDKPWNWYDPSCVNVDGGGTLCLSIKKNPREFDLPGKGIVRSEYGIGLVSSVDYFGYGTYSILASLPKGRGLWPAFWIYDHNDWPPEIDIFEGYSGRRGDYKNGILKRIIYPYAIESCFHSHGHLPIPRVRPKSPCWLNLIGGVCNIEFNPFDYNTYSLIWTPVALIFKINGFIVREIRDPRIMEYLKDRKMRVLINTHIHGPYKDNFTAETDFKIVYFEHIAFDQRD
jgi:beta-glucanase (GH16 family)